MPAKSSPNYAKALVEEDDRFYDKYPRCLRDDEMLVEAMNNPGKEITSDSMQETPMEVSGMMVIKIKGQNMKKKMDLNKDGKLSSYEKKRGMAIMKAMSKKKKKGKKKK